MKECFISKDFNPQHLDIIEKANNILENYESQGYDLSLRQLFYQFVTRNWIENTERSYKSLGGIISEARLAGLIDWDMIKDRGRECVENSDWSNPGEIVDICARQFRLNRWRGQKNYVEVMVEKQALEGVLIPVCREYHVRFTANKGYSSSSAMYEAGKRYMDAVSNDQQVHIIYLGDHDPSGIDMSRDVTDRARLFGENEDNINIHRIALNMPQIEELRPPENPAKITDSRANSYIQRFGRSSWELDAIEPSRLASLVSSAIHNLRDDDIFEEVLKEESGMRDKLKAIASKIIKPKKSGK